MEPKGSLLCSREIDTGPYLQPDQASLYHFSDIKFIIIFTPTYVFLMASFLPAFSPKPCMQSADSVRTKCPTHLVLLDLIILVIFDEE
jgi:hypothetical protein